ncbi:hypothetical protein SDC9_180225 [bioreactor metagenome]|uniref:Uncharacterized protein n=1 Tax=bioreactor metagenome TaxID=1076179 RepID=A0A645H127_9ZZZZ
MSSAISSRSSGGAQSSAGLAGLLSLVCGSPAASNCSAACFRKNSAACADDRRGEAPPVFLESGRLSTAFSANRTCRPALVSWISVTEGTASGARNRFPISGSPSVADRPIIRGCRPVADRSRESRLSKWMPRTFPRNECTSSMTTNSNSRYKRGTCVP